MFSIHLLLKQILSFSFIYICVIILKSILKQGNSVNIFNASLFILYGYLRSFYKAPELDTCVRVHACMLSCFGHVRLCATL